MLICYALSYPYLLGSLSVFIALNDSNNADWPNAVHKIRGSISNTQFSGGANYHQNWEFNFGTETKWIMPPDIYT